MKKVKEYVKGLYDEYIDKSDWRVKENSNNFFSFGGMNKYVVGKTSAEYWKTYYDMFDENILRGHEKGDYHIHDLGGLTTYCFGASLKDLLLKGITKVPNVSESAPPKRLRAVTSQIANIMTIYQNETMGAIAFSSWNAYLAPFLYFDKLRRDVKLAKVTGGNIKYKGNPYTEYEELNYNELDMEDIVQSVQNMIYALNSNSRAGAEPAFTNITLDFKILNPMVEMPIIIGGEESDVFTFGQFQKEADILTEVFSKIMYDGDENGNAFSYPIPTFNIGKNMDWDNEKYKYVWEASAKYGVPYFGNFLHGNLDENDVYSMCCRLRLDKRELMNKTGGLFGAGEKTGSLGVFTINLPSLAYECKDRSKIVFFNRLEKRMDMGRKHLVLKKMFIKNMMERGAYPALSEYLGTLDTLFLTIGLTGGNEMCLNYLGEGIETKNGKEFMLEVLNFMKEKLSTYQEETGELFNLEATPE